MRTLLAGFFFLAFCATPAATEDKKETPIVPPREGKNETFKLFDGKTLDGWEGYEDLWSVNKYGVIVGTNATPLKYSTYLLTKEKYTDFRLTFATKLVEDEMHSGVSFWGEVSPKADGKVTDAKKDRSEFTYKGHLVMFPSGWGSTICSAAPAYRWTVLRLEKWATSITGTTSRFWRKGIAFGWPRTAFKSWIGATRSPIALKPDRSVCNCTRTGRRRKSTLRGSPWKPSRRKISSSP